MQVSIVSPEERVWQGEADMVVARTPEGELAILKGHIPFLGALVPAPVKVVSDGSEEVFLVTGGVIEASGSRDEYHVIVLADNAERASDIDAAEAGRLLEEAERNVSDGDERSQNELRIARARVTLAEAGTG